MSERCKQVDDGLVEPIEELCEEVETVRGFCYLGDSVNSSGEMAILRRTERAICGAKLMEKKRTEDLVEMLGLKETVVQMAKANGVRWYGYVLRRDDGHILRKALDFEVKGNRKRGRPKKT